MNRSTFKPRLATENGRRVGRTAKAKRLAAQPATDAARLMRSLVRIREVAEEAQAKAEQAELVLAAAFQAACGDDPVVARALAREALIECVTSHRFKMLAVYCEMAEEGTLCA